MAYTILTDEDLGRLVTPRQAVRVIQDALEEHAAGSLVAPPRFQVEAKNGALVFTVGAAEAHGAVGFRVYETISPGHEDDDQIVAVFDSTSGKLRGLVIGSRLGALRTGAIGGVAVRHLARHDVRTLGVIGTGRQARTQIEAVVTVRAFETIRVFGRSAERRASFAQDLTQRIGQEVVPAASAEEAVRGADVVITATTSRTPVFDPDWLAPGAHVSTLGPNLASGHELALAVAERANVIVTDSRAQVDGYALPFFLAETPMMARLVELSAIVAGRAPSRTSPADLTLFCSVGLAGTEVALAQVALAAALDSAADEAAATDAAAGAE